MGPDMTSQRPTGAGAAAARPDQSTIYKWKSSSKVCCWRAQLHMEDRVRELALFNLGIDSKLRGCDLVGLKVRDICHGDQVAGRAVVMQHKTERPVQFEITQVTREAVLIGAPTAKRSEGAPDLPATGPVWRTYRRAASWNDLGITFPARSGSSSQPPSLDPDKRSLAYETPLERREPIILPLRRKRVASRRHLAVKFLATSALGPLPSRNLPCR